MAYTLPLIRLRAAMAFPHPRTGTSSTPSGVRARFFRYADGILHCHVCPRACTLAPGERGVCRGRAREGNRIVSTRYGNITDLCMDPVEKKPLFHFLPGTAALSFGTVGCNLACDFCQNWRLSQSDDEGLDHRFVPPTAVANAALRHKAASVAMTYNDPVVFYEYAMDVAGACRAVGVHPVAVTAAYLTPAAAALFFRGFDAANVDLKAFSPRFYREHCNAELSPVLDALRIAREKTKVWLEITTLLIPGENDSDQELRALSDWIVTYLGRQTPVHFSAFHPDHALLDRAPTPRGTLVRARDIAKTVGLHHVYVGNTSFPDGEATICPDCHAPLITRDRYTITGYRLTANGACPACGRKCEGVFGGSVGDFGNRRFTVLPDYDPAP